MIKIIKTQQKFLKMSQIACYPAFSSVDITGNQFYESLPKFSY